MSRLLPHEEKHRWILRVPIFLENHLANILSWLSPIAVIALTVLASIERVSLWGIVLLGIIAATSLILGNMLQSRRDGSIREAGKRSFPSLDIPA